MEQINDDVRNIVNNRHINLEEGGGDYVDKLLPGYRFCPTDSELILYYLIPKIETGNHPSSCRVYEVNLYDHTPDELAERYRGCDGKWYFLTPRERKYPKGDLPNRITREGGRWKSTQVYTPVYHDDGQSVGMRRSLDYNKNKCKTAWLMHEYTINDPNNPVGTTDEHNGSNKLTNWVLCKIYKREKPTAANNNNNTQSRNLQQARRNNNEERNLQQSDEQRPSQRRRRTQPQHIQIQEANHQAATNVINDQMGQNEIEQFMWDSNQQCSLDDIMRSNIANDHLYPANQTSPPQQIDIQEANHHSIAYDHGQMSSSSSEDSDDDIMRYIVDDLYPDDQTSPAYEGNTASSSISMLEQLLLADVDAAQPPAFTDPVTSTNHVPLDVIAATDHMNVLPADDFNTTTLSLVDEDNLVPILDSLECIYNDAFWSST